MKVTAIQPVTTKKFRIVMEEQLAFVLYKSELSRYQIAEDRELKEEHYREIMEEVLPLRAKRYAMNLLVKGDRTEKELIEKLKKAGYPEMIVELAMNYVKSFGYINDERYAIKYLETFQDRQSIKALSWKLQQKGIAKQIIDKAICQCELEDTQETIRNLIEKRLRSKKLTSEKDVRNMAAYLGRRGFMGEEVWRVLKDYTISERNLME